MKKQLIAVAASVLLLFGVTACGSAGAANSGPAVPDGPSRTVVDAEGTEVKVPENPERIVALSEPTLDGLLALDIEPIGAVSGRGQSAVPNYLQDRAGDIKLLGGVAQPNFEAIGAAKPDLILVDGTSINNNPPVIAALRRIAPVVYTGYAGGDWRKNFELVAEATNKQDAAAKVLAEYDEAIAAAKPQLEQFNGKTFSIVRWQGNSAALILKELPPGRALSDLGLARPANQDREGRGHSEPVSLENLTEIDADYIFFGTLGGSSVGNPNAGGTADIEGAELALAEAAKAPGFTSLNAYQNDQIILVDGSAWTSTGGPILMRTIVDNIIEALVTS